MANKDKVVMKSKEKKLARGTQKAGAGTFGSTGLNTSFQGLEVMERKLILQAIECSSRREGGSCCREDITVGQNCWPNLASPRGGLCTGKNCKNVNN